MLKILGARYRHNHQSASMHRGRCCRLIEAVIDIITMLPVDARKCDADNRARGDTTCYEYASFFSPSLFSLLFSFLFLCREFHDNAAYGSIPGVATPGSLPPFHSIPSRPTSSCLRAFTRVPTAPTRHEISRVFVCVTRE